MDKRHLGHLTLAALLAAAPAAKADPWIAYGQTQIGVVGAVSAAPIDNPAPNVNGILGEVRSWPFIVPSGYVLVLEDYNVEAYNQPGTTVLVPWIGQPPATNPKTLASAASWGGNVGHVTGKFYLPAGTALNIRLETLQTPGWVASWYLSGELLPVDQLPAATLKRPK